MSNDQDEVLDLGEGFDDDTSASITREKWMQAQRDLVTTTLDYNLNTISQLVRDRAIDLAPAFQRRDRWDRKRQSQLIESFLMNVPLPPIFLNEDNYGEYSIIDGKQRLTAISEFLQNRFELTGLEVFTEAEGMTFSQLDRDLRSVLETRASLRAIIILRMSDPDVKYQVFQRLNSGGVRLNAQELRNVAYAGPLNDLFALLAERPAYRELLGLAVDSARDKSALWRQMRDVELVLRYFTLMRSWDAFSGSLVREMNDFMGEYRDAGESARLEYERDFEAAVQKAAAVFGPDAYRRYNASTGRYGNVVVASVFDAHMIGLAPFALKTLTRHADEIKLRMEKLFAEPDFLEVIGAATNTPSSVRRRISMVRDLVAEVVGS